MSLLVVYSLSAIEKKQQPSIKRFLTGRCREGKVCVTFSREKSTAHYPLRAGVQRYLGWRNTGLEGKKQRQKLRVKSYLIGTVFPKRNRGALVCLAQRGGFAVTL